LEVVNPPEYTQLGKGYRESDVNWIVHIVMEQLDAADGTMEQNLTIFDLKDTVVALLSGQRPPGCSSLFSTREEQDFKHTNVYHFKVHFKCGFIDSIGSPFDAGVIDKNFEAAPLPLELVIDASYGQDEDLLTEDGCVITDNENDIYQTPIIA
jgi:hypothetical protein